MSPFRLGRRPKSQRHWGRRLGLRRRLALRIFSDLYKKTVATHRLDTLFWECTLRCNLACRHCGSDCRVDALAPDMPIEDFLHVLDREVTPHVDPAQVLIIFSGGEVLVRDDLERAGMEVTRRGYAWGMVTNGLALDGVRLQSLLAAGLRSVSVSLDGFEQEHNHIRRNPHSYARALAALRLIVREPSLTYDVVTCVTGAMIGRLEAFRDTLIAEGVTHWRLFSIFPMGRAANDASLRISDEQFRALLEFIRRTRREGRIDVSYACEGFLGRYEGEVRDHFYQCAAGVSVASIRVDGAISGCTSIRADYHQGNIYRDKFWDVWQNRFEVFRDRSWARKPAVDAKDADRATVPRNDQTARKSAVPATDKTSDPNPCATCDMFRYCMGGGMHLRGEDGKLLYCHYKRL